MNEVFQKIKGKMTPELRSRIEDMKQAELGKKTIIFVP
jgi:hypothetical protein